MKFKLYSMTISVNQLTVPVFLAALVMGQLIDYFFIFLFAFIHELAHVFASRLLRLRTQAIEIHPAGMSAGIEIPSTLSFSKEMLLYASGAASNIIIALLVLAVGPILSVDAGLVNRIVLVNLFLACLNILPIFPLDGGRMLELVLRYKVSYFKSVNICIKTSRITALATVVPSALILYYTGNISLFLLCVFILVYSFKNVSWLKSKSITDILHKKNCLKTGYVYKSRIIAAHMSVSLIKLAEEFNAGSYCLIVILDDSHKAAGVVGEVDVTDGILLYGPKAMLAKLVPEKI